MTPSQLADLFRSHSRLSGAMAGNLDVWLREERTLPRYLDLIPTPAPGETKLLEIGCYQPTVGYYFSLGWRDVLGVFKDDGEGTTVDDYVGDQGARARLIKCDIEHERLPVEDGWADVVIMMQVWEHFAVDPMHVLWELNRVLKPGGRLILSTPNGACWLYAMRIALGKAAWASMEFNGFGTNRHNRLYDASEIAVILGQAGFDVSSCVSREYGHLELSWRERVFRFGLAAIDTFAALVSGRRRERGTTVVAKAVKSRAPLERFPTSLYLSDSDWPGLAEERERMLARRLGGAR